MSGVIDELEIPAKWREEFLSWGVEYEADTGSSGEMIYGYYFTVPEEADRSFLRDMGWSVGQCIEVSLNAFDTPDYD